MSKSYDFGQEAEKRAADFLEKKDTKF